MGLPIAIPEVVDVVRPKSQGHASSQCGSTCKALQDLLSSHAVCFAQSSRPASTQGFDSVAIAERAQEAPPAVCRRVEKSSRREHTNPRSARGRINGAELLAEEAPPLPLLRPLASSAILA